MYDSSEADSRHEKIIAVLSNKHKMIIQYIRVEYKKWEIHRGSNKFFITI